jgi:hypothetical protein
MLQFLWIRRIVSSAVALSLDMARSHGICRIPDGDRDEKEDDRMSSQLSVAEILARLEAEMAFHRERESHHAQHEAFHREQRTSHGAEYEKVASNYEAFKASAETASEIAGRAAALVPPPQPVKRVLPSRLVARWVQESPAGEIFAPTRVSEEVKRRFGAELSRPMSSRLASTALRRLLSYGEVRLVKKGTAHREALYTRS